MDLSDKLSDITCTCLALDPRPDILLTQSARSVNFLKRGFRQRLKRHICDHVSINKLSSVLTLTSWEVWLIQCQMDDEVATSVPMPAGFLHHILTKDFSLHKKSALKGTTLYCNGTGFHNT